METKSELACAWSGIVYAVVWGIGMALIARYLPPTSPNLGAQEIAALYEQNRNLIRTGSIVMFIGNGFYLSFTAIISIVMWRAGYRLWASVQLLGGGVGAVAPFVSTMFWSVAAFRPDRDPQVILALNDVAWFFAIMFTIPVFFQYLAVGIVGLMGKGSDDPWPRWVGFFSIWMGTVQQPAPLLTYFKTGPFAWDGLFGFWIPAIAFFGWITVMVSVLLKSIRLQANSQQTSIRQTG